MERIGLVVHPRRELGGALETLRTWAGDRGTDVVQVRTPGSPREVAPQAAVETCDLVVALGGDGTALAALRVSAPARKPVLGVACGSLGALTAVTAELLRPALERVESGDWTTRALPALDVEHDGEPPPLAPCVNDLVVVRRGAGQVLATVRVDGDLYVRFGGDGLVLATPLGSTAYALAAGGPVLAPGALGIVVAPLAPHGGSCPPLVTGPAARVEVELEPGHGGARVEGDGQPAGDVERMTVFRLSARLRPEHATLIELNGQERLLTGLRRRRVLIDSPRLLARDDREALRP